MGPAPVVPADRVPGSEPADRVPAVAVGRAAVPRGASPGQHEANEPRDTDAENRFLGKGVRQAVDNVNSRIVDVLIDLDVTDQAELDRGGAADVDLAAVGVRAAIVDPHDHAFAGARVGHADLGAEGQRLVRGGVGIHVEPLATRGAATVELGAVIGRDAAAPHFGLRLDRRLEAVDVDGGSAHAGCRRVDIEACEAGVEVGCGGVRRNDLVGQRLRFGLGYFGDHCALARCILRARSGERQCEDTECERRQGDAAKGVLVPVHGEGT